MLHCKCAWIPTYTYIIHNVVVMYGVMLKDDSIIIIVQLYCRYSTVQCVYYNIHTNILIGIS